MTIESVTKDQFCKILEEEGHVKIDSFVESAIELAEEVHGNLKREDGKSSFLETHIWPVTVDVVRHYRSSGKLLTTLQIVSSILHDIMEDDEQILDQYAKSYGFDAYFRHRFGDYVYNVASDLRITPIETYQKFDAKNRQHIRFREYTTKLANAKYDVKVIKIADRLNNMNFVSHLPNNKKIERYVREAEDFYIGFTLFPPVIDEFYFRMREAYEELKLLKISA